ncbi:6148_t:CDS:10 [Ambispora leptoticha]|uniref:AP-3 complex subunit delta n=1 Tax=Ambispora leptoticha TaxID=144679 RepID=A0A9N8ZI92_9GLOM|nr:6148_t:CDS:10 [Ambispora leptoticha]
MCKHILNAQVSIRAPCCKRWFDCAECHAEASDHPVRKTSEMVFACKKCKKVFRKDMENYDETDEYCPHCDNHYVIEAKTPQMSIGVEETLTGLIRGIRANKKNEQKYIAERLQEIHKEVKSNDPDVKAMAISKLTYLHMLGYDMSWASFHVVEVMSSAKFSHKRSGYLAATQSFRQDTDVLMLTTNLLKKDLASGNHLEVGVALNGLSHIVTPDLARDLSQDLVSMLGHSRPYVRKKVVLVLYKIFLKFPEALRLSFPRLKERLEDSDPSVVSAVVNVVCELARKNPRNYLSLAPQLFKLLTTSANNWMLIKIIKLFGALTPLEPRLSKKLLPPITNLIQTTEAMSLLYECIHTVIIGGMLNTLNSDALASMCVNKLRIFLEDPDQNLKYIGLLALGKILPTHPRLVAEHRDIILKCIDDADISIRLRALDLVVGMVNKKNLPDIVKRLMAHLLPSSNDDNENNTVTTLTLLEPVYRTDIINRILYICSQNSYSNITNFEWYVAVLVDLTFVAGVKVGDLLTAQIMDVAVRVKSVRNYCVKAMQKLLSNSTLLENCTLSDSNSEVLYAAAWVAGEYCSYLDDPPEVIEYLLRSGVTKLPHNVQSVYIHNVLKIYSFWANSLLYNWDRDAKEDLVRVTEFIKEKIGMFCSCTNLEVQERAYNVREMITIIHQNITTIAPESESISLSEKPPSIITELPPLFFSYELNPVAPKAQKKVPIPEGLDLDAWINEPLPDSEGSENERDGEDEESYGYGYGQKVGGSGDLVFSSGNGPAVGRRPRRGKKGQREYESEEDEDVKERRRNERKERMKNDPYYIGVDDDSTSKKQKSKSNRLRDDIDVDSIPVVHLNMDDFDTQSRKLTTKSRKHHKKNKESVDETTSPPPSAPIIYTDVGEMPENATLTDDDEKDGLVISTDNNNNISNPLVSPLKSSTFWKKNQEENKGILDVDFSGISNIDLSTPLGDDEKFPQTTVYLSPEEVRRREEERINRQIMEERRAKHAKAVDVAAKPKKEETMKKKSTKKNSKQNVVADEKIEPLKKLLIEENGIEVRYSLRLSSSEEPKNEPPSLVAVFTISNKSISKNDDNSINSSSDAYTISQIMFKFEPSSDIQFESTLLRLDGELVKDEKKEAVVSFRVLGIVGTGLYVNGRLTCEKHSSDGTQESSSNTSLDFPFTFPIPISVYMLQIPPITPERFSLIVSKTSELPFVGSTTISLDTTSTALMSSSSFSLQQSQSAEQLFQSTLVELTTLLTGTHVVEMVPGAASIYGESVQGYQVAGLVKLNKTEQFSNTSNSNGSLEDSLQLQKDETLSSSLLNDSSSSNTATTTSNEQQKKVIASITVEFKCTDQAFVDGLILEIERFSQKT